MAFNPDQFASSLYKTGVAKTCNYDVFFNLPQQLFGGGSDSTYNDTFIKEQEVPFQKNTIEESLLLRVESCDMPGRTVATLDSFTYGIPTKVGFRQSFADVNMVIILSEDLRERILFDQWMSLIVGYRTSADVSLSQEQSVFDIGYYKSYATDVTIRQYDNTGDEKYSVKLINAYPTIILPIQATWQNEEIAKLQVTFSYEYYTHVTKMSPDHPSTIQRGNWLNTSGLTGALTTGGGILRNTIKSRTGF